MKHASMNRRLAITLVVLPLLFASAFAQGNLNMKKLLSLPGKVVSEAKSARPSGALKLTGYRVEEVQLPSNQTVELHGQQTVVRSPAHIGVQHRDLHFVHGPAIA